MGCEVFRDSFCRCIIMTAPRERISSIVEFQPLTDCGAPVTVLIA